MLKNQIKNLDVLDIALIKLAVACFVLFLVFGFIALHDALAKIQWWIYLLLAIVLAIRPQMRAWGKKKGKKKKK